MVIGRIVREIGRARIKSEESDLWKSMCGRRRRFEGRRLVPEEDDEGARPHQDKTHIHTLRILPNCQRAKKDEGRK